MKRIAEQLPGQFLRAHRSYIVNRDHIERFDGQVAHVGATAIPVGDAFRRGIPQRPGNRRLRSGRPIRPQRPQFPSGLPERLQATPRIASSSMVSARSARAARAPGGPNQAEPVLQPMVEAPGRLRRPRTQKVGDRASGIVEFGRQCIEIAPPPCAGHRRTALGQATDRFRWGAPAVRGRWWCRIGDRFEKREGVDRLPNEGGNTGFPAAVEQFA